MRITFTICLLILCVITLCAREVNGDTLTVEGKKILKVWGTHDERGYAHGYLMGQQIREVALEYFLGGVFGNNPYYYEETRNYFLVHFLVEEKYQTEVSSMITGMVDAGVDIYSEVLERDLDGTDLFMANSVVDFVALNMYVDTYQFGCSSMSSWGQSTANDPELQGEPLITRNMDWTPNPVVLDNHLLMVQIPAEENELAWVAFTFSGLIGALSGINEAGISAFMNMGNINSYDDENQLHPVFLTIRNGLEQCDYNNDGNNDTSDIHAAVEDKLHLSASIIHAVDNDDALIIECNNTSGTVVRTVDHNQIICGTNLVATNHFRLLYPPVYCDRYQHFADSLSADSCMTIDRSWQVTTGAGGVSHNLHTIQFVPGSGLIKWSTAKPGHPAYTLPPTLFYLQDLLVPGSTTGDHLISGQELDIVVCPNPFGYSTSISFTLPSPQSVILSLYNIKGQLIRELAGNDIHDSRQCLSWDGRDAAGNRTGSGIYLYRLEIPGRLATGRIIKIN
ncbi:MAG: T9SS type A sorting domain-containing protein [Candidatus Cloacimonetes bacterium]|nr:T9SS type A sorting domain-containing protein [Candidatus Cloacimonadota bacterium]